jgi:hypothetical protein
LTFYNFYIIDNQRYAGRNEMLGVTLAGSA